MPTKTSEELNQQARDAALAAVSSISVQPTSLLQYESRGVVAVIGGERALQAAAMMNDGLKVQLVLDDSKRAGDVPCTLVRQRDLSVEGYLGNFTVTLTGASPEDTESMAADLVLDLTGDPLLTMPLTPPGYLAPGPEETELQAAVEQLSSMTGTFEKPKYFDYNPSLCAHGRSGITACSRCIDACPAEAISSLAEAIEVNPYLCQGGGVCATACPSGAISYVYPSADDTLALLRRLLKVYRDEGGDSPIVLLHAAETIVPESSPANLLPVALEELASAGIDSWLSALAYGAAAVLLLDDGTVSERVGRELDQQLVTANEILRGMGYPAGVVRRVDASDLQQAGEQVMPSTSPAAFAGAGTKRQTVFLAIDALYEQAVASMAKHPLPMVTLTAGAPFGAAGIDEKSCTLCMSCVSACPGKALQSGQDVPQLRFIESNCLQCGLCTRTCPEDAIWITPRILFDREKRGQLVTLHEEEPFCCVSCGKPFASRAVINNMMAKLKDHWMFTDENAKRRLMMCEDCRVVDVIQDEEMMGKGVGQGRVTH